MPKVTRAHWDAIYQQAFERASTAEAEWQDADKSRAGKPAPLSVLIPIILSAAGIESGPK